MMHHRSHTIESHKKFAVSFALFFVIEVFFVLSTTPIGFGGVYWSYRLGGTASIVRVSADGDYVVAGEEFSGKIYLFSANGSLIWTYDHFPTDLEVEDIGVSGDGNRIVVSLDEYLSGEPDTFLLDNLGNVIWQKDLFQRSVSYHLALSPDAKCFVAGDTNDVVSFFDIDGNLIWNYTAGDWITTVSTSIEGECTAVGSMSKSLYFFNKTGNLLWTHDFNYSVEAVSVSPEGDYVAAASSVDRELLLFDKNGSILSTTKFGEFIEGVSVSANGERIAVGADGKNVTVIDKTGNVMCEWKADEDAHHVAITADGKFLAFVCGNYVNFLEVLSPSKIECDVFPEVVFLGSSVTIDGLVSPSISGVQVKLEYILYFQNSSWSSEGFANETRTVITSSDGLFTDAFTPSGEGKWKVIASWDGGAQHTPSKTEVLFTANPAGEISILSAAPSKLYWHRDKWYCDEVFPSSPTVRNSHFLMNTSMPLSGDSSTVSFYPGGYWWIGHPEWDYWGAHTGTLSKNTLIEKGIWNLSIWASTRSSNQHFIVELYYWDKDHHENYIASRNSGPFNSTSPDLPDEFGFYFDLPEKVVPEGSCLGFVIDAGPDTDVTLFFDSTQHPSYLIIPPSTEFIDGVPPAIASPTQQPVHNVQPSQNVTITVAVTDVGLGVCNVTLWCSIDNDGTWVPQKMINVHGDTYQSEICGYDSLTHVSYRISAYDNAGNLAVNDNQGHYYVYQVVPEFPMLTGVLLLLFLFTAMLLTKKPRLHTRQTILT